MATTICVLKITQELGLSARKFIGDRGVEYDLSTALDPAHRFGDQFPIWFEDVENVEARDLGNIEVADFRGNTNRSKDVTH